MFVTYLLAYGEKLNVNDCVSSTFSTPQMICVPDLFFKKIKQWSFCAPTCDPVIPGAF